jgi:pyridoxamine-phosphate oxidase
VRWKARTYACAGWPAAAIEGYHREMNVEHNLESVDPLELFARWLKEAETSEPNDANAAALATSTAGGNPSVRMVLVKRADDRGFCFFTNAESKKGMQLQANPRAALCFHWKSLRRQVRVEGRVTEMASVDVDEYFHSRSRNSQISAHRTGAASACMQTRSSSGSLAKTAFTTGTCLPAMPAPGRKPCFIRS